MFRSSRKSDSSKKLSSRGTDDEAQYYSDSSASRKSVASVSSGRSANASPFGTRGGASSGAHSTRDALDLRKTVMANQSHFPFKGTAPPMPRSIPSTLALAPDPEPTIYARAGTVHLRYASVPQPTRGKIRFVCVSDTHGKDFEVPMGDVLLHSGDLSRNGTVESLEVTLRWLMKMKHQYKMYALVSHALLSFSRYYLTSTPSTDIKFLHGRLIHSVIAGNHDLTLHGDYYRQNWERWPAHRGRPAVCRAPLPSVILF